MRNSDLEELLQNIEKDYKTEIVPITISGRSLRCIKIADLDEIIIEQLDKGDLNGVELPYWGKIWEASILLATYLMAQGERSWRLAQALGLVVSLRLHAVMM